jgi:glycosyltransferase involved in cell wall biosynthesis
MLRIGVDAWNLVGDRRGIGRYVRSILDEWTSMPGQTDVSLIVPEWHTWTVAARYRNEAGGLPYRVVSRALHRRARFDVLWFPWNGCSWTTFSQPAVATLHDATVFDLPGYTQADRRIFLNAAERCRAVITDSAFSAERLHAAFGPSSVRIVPILPGVHTPPVVDIPPRIEALRPFALFVGTAEERKGLGTLIAAMREVQRDGDPLALVVAGDPGGRTIAEADVRMEHLGFVEDAELHALYRAAALFVYPSRYEGFGLPVLEAMAAGTPVIASRAAAIPEAGGDAALYVEPGDAAALARAIRTLRTDSVLAGELRTRGAQRAAAMSWRATAERTLEVLRESAGSV